MSKINPFAMNARIVNPVIIGAHKPISEKKLTTKGRKQIKSDNFALPGRRYPIHDKAHARNALSRVSQYGTPAEKAKVRAAVHRKFPGIGKNGK